MGKGDIRTKKGKIVKGSFGKSRPHKPAKGKKNTPAPKGEKGEG
ncbi:30S ribosomal protein THX [Compostibacter hankyongensis]|uniref:30S ribosomal protein THX n=1 Tax=Compostibacter hankyongensis TaxID=1007089 RepID=A0ABP8G5Z5_9BACT